MNQQLMALLTHGFGAHQQGQLAEAEHCYQQVLSIQPQQVDALYLLGLLKLQLGDLPNAAASLSNVATLAPDHVDAHLHLGIALAQQGQAERAMFHFSKAKTLAPENPAPYFNMGFTYIGLEKYEAAVVEFENALKLNPAYLEALNNLGNANYKLGRYEEAVACFKKSLALVPDYPNALLGLSAALCKCEAYEAALDTVNRLLQIVPNASEAHENKGVVLAGLEDYGGAIDEYKKALALNTGASSEIYVKLGLACTKQKFYAEAFEACQKSLELNPSSSDAYVTLGMTHVALKQYDDAFAAYRKALELDPANSEALINLAAVHVALKQYTEAFITYQKVLALNPDNSDVYNNLGLVNAALKQYVDAFAAYREALLLNPNDPDVYNNLANLHSELGQNEDALAAFSRALALKPAYQWLQGQLLHMRMRLCDWSCYEQSVRQIDSGIGQHQKICTPFPMLSFSASLHLQKACAEIYANSEMLANVVTVAPEYQHAKIRIGYLSCDFREHALSYLMSGVIAVHDRGRFEVYGFDFSLDDESATRKKILNAFDQVHKVFEMSDQDISSLIRRLEIDILVDITGHTKDARAGILASRPAPIQVNYLGYPGTMGASCMDYIVGDATLMPPEYRDGYSEKIAYLPECFQANDISRQIGVSRTRLDVGLDEQVFVFGCFNQCVKFTPTVFTVWMSILKQVPNSVLWLIKDSQTQVENLKSFAIAHGVPADRLVFAEKLPYAEHLARYALMDLALDTFPFNGGTTTSDALWGGAPVLTYSGETFASRMAASLLNAVGLPELVTSSLAAYEAMAVELATQPTKLDALRQRLAINRLTSPLFDTPRFTRHLEAAYEQMVSRSRQGLEPDHIFVPALTA